MAIKKAKKHLPFETDWPFRSKMYWILNEKNEPVHPKSFEEWSNFLWIRIRIPRKLKKLLKKHGKWRGRPTCANPRKIVCRTILPKGLGRVSTVFLGLNHGPDSSPILFETMVFGGEHDGYQDRYSTWEEAKAGHQQVIEMVFNVERIETVQI